MRSGRGSSSGLTEVFGIFWVSFLEAVTVHAGPGVIYPCDTASLANGRVTISRLEGRSTSAEVVKVATLLAPVFPGALTAEVSQNASPSI